MQNMVNELLDEVSSLRTQLAEAQAAISSAIQELTMRGDNYKAASILLNVNSDTSALDTLVSQAEAEARAEMKERCAVAAWMHYMDTCKKTCIHPAHFDQFIASTAIRALPTLGECNNDVKPFDTPDEVNTAKAVQAEQEGDAS